jgi:hypothetical protein
LIQNEWRRIVSSRARSKVTFTDAQLAKIIELGNRAEAAIDAADSQGGPAPVGVWRPMYDYILKVMRAEGIAGAQSYWFQEAGAINANEMSDPAGFFVRDITALGLNTNLEDPRLQDVSDLIGRKCLRGTSLLAILSLTGNFGGSSTHDHIQ